MSGKKLFWVLPMVLLSAPVWAQSDLEVCGTSGTLKARIQECKALNGDAASNKMTLVMADGDHLLKMDATGLLWGDPYIRPDRGRVMFDGALAACRDVTEADGYPEIAGMEEWRLPTAEEWDRIGNETQDYFPAGKGGDWSFTALSDYHLIHWSSSPIDEKQVWGFIGYDGGGAWDDSYGMGKVIPVDRDSTYLAVRCVTRSESHGTD